MWLLHLFFFPALFMTRTFFLKQSSGPFPLRYSGVWFMNNPICILVLHRNRCRESRPYHEDWRATFQLLFVAPLVCFCRSLHSTPSITWPVYYRLRVFNIVKFSRNLEEKEKEGFWYLLHRPHRPIGALAYSSSKDRKGPLGYQPKLPNTPTSCSI